MSDDDDDVNWAVCSVEKCKMKNQRMTWFLLACSYWVFSTATLVSVFAEDQLDPAESKAWSECYRKSDPIHSRCLRTAADLQNLVHLNIRSHKTIRRKYSQTCDEARRVWLRN